MEGHECSAFEAGYEVNPPTSLLFLKNVVGKTRLFWLFAVLYGLKIVVQLGSGYTQEINIDPECDFPQELFSSLSDVASVFRSYYKLPTRNSEEPYFLYGSIALIATP